MVSCPVTPQELIAFLHKESGGTEVEVGRGVVKQNDSDLNLALKDLLDLLHPGRPRGESFSPFCAGILSGFRAREERGDSDSDRKKKWLFRGCWNTLAALSASCSPLFNYFQQVERHTI